MVDLQTQVAEIEDELKMAIDAVFASGAFVRGPFVKQFEDELAEYLGGTHAIGVGNGTDALQIAYMVLGVGSGDEVITPAFTFVATAEAAALLGARPVFVDIDLRTFTLDPEQVEAAITEKTKAIVPVHLYGQSADMDALMAISRRTGVPIVEDAAQSVSATYKGQTTGYIGDFGCLSFYPSKNLGAFGDGGAILTNNDELAKQARVIANHGGTSKYHNDVIGVNSRLDAIHATMLSVKLRHLDTWTRARQSAADIYDRAFAGSSITPPHRAADRNHVFHQYTIRVPRGTRDALQKKLKAQGIPSMIYYPVPLHQLKAYADLGRTVGDLSETVQATRNVISLPMHPHLTESQVERITTAVLTFYGEN